MAAYNSELFSHICSECQGIEEPNIFCRIFEREAHGAIAAFDAAQSPKFSALSLFWQRDKKLSPGRVCTYQFMKGSTEVVHGFAQQLMSQLTVTFVTVSPRLMQKLKRVKGCKMDCFRPASLLRMLHGQDVWTWRGIAERAGWTLRYARLNVLALRKILKKHDKVMRSHFGKELLQVACHLHQLVPVPVIHRTIMHMSCTPNGRASSLTYPTVLSSGTIDMQHAWLAEGASTGDVLQDSSENNSSEAGDAV